MNNKIVNNTIWIIGGKIFQMALTLIISMFIARYLGPENYGIINYSASFIAFFTPVSSLGLDGIIVNELVKGEHKENDIIGTCIVMRLMAGIISSLSICILIYVLNPNDKILLVVAFLQSLSLPIKAFESINFWFQYKLKSKYIVIAQIIAYMNVSIYKIWLLITGKGVVWFAASVFIEAIVLSTIISIQYTRRKGVNFKFIFTYGKEMLSKGYSFIIAGILTTLYMQIDKIMIGNMIDKTNVGIYAAAATITGVWSFIPLAIVESFRPIIMEAKEKAKIDEYERKLQLTFSLVLWCSIFLATLTVVFGKWIVLILYGNSYQGAREVLYFYYVGIIFPYIGNVRSLWLICEEKYKYVKKFSLYGALLNVLLNYVLINVMGIWGAALATSLTQIVLHFIIPLIYKDTRNYVKYLKNALNIKKILRDYNFKEYIKIILNRNSKDRL